MELLRKSEVQMLARRTIQVIAAVLCIEMIDSIKDPDPPDRYLQQARQSRIRLTELMQEGAQSSGELLENQLIARRDSMGYLEYFILRGDTLLPVLRKAYTPKSFAYGTRPDERYDIASSGVLVPFDPGYAYVKLPEFTPGMLKSPEEY